MLIGIRHAALPVSDLDRALRFYRDVLGFETAYAGDADWVMVSQGGTTLSLIRFSGGSAPSLPSGKGSHPAHLGIVAIDAASVDRMSERIRREHPEVPCQPPKRHRDDSYGFYLRDPDGNALEVIFIPHGLKTPRPAPEDGQAIVLLAHGSRDPRWHRPVGRFLEVCRTHLPRTRVELGYLEEAGEGPGAPLEAALDAARSAGPARIAVAPLFLGAGAHLNEELPGRIDRWKTRQTAPPEVTVLPPLGESDLVREAFVSDTLAALRRAWYT